MALVIPPGFGLLAYRFALSTDPEVMITTIGVDLGENPGGPQSVVENAATQFTSAFGPAQMGSNWTFLGCHLRTGGNGASYEAPRANGGSAGAITMPNNCAFLVRKITAGIGRRARGRMFLPPFTINESDILQNGQMTATSITTLQGLVNSAFLDPGLVLLHDELPSPLAPTPITQLILDPKIATQRRRMRR